MSAHAQPAGLAENPTVRLTIPAKAEYITLVRLALSGISRRRPLSEEVLGDLKLAVTEACTNSVVHGYENGEGTVPKVLVHRFVGVWPGETCEREVTPPTLTNTYWKILRLGDTEISTGPDRREPNLMLREGESRYVATVGCNQLVGGYALGDGKLAFSAGARTRRVPGPASCSTWWASPRSAGWPIRTSCRVACASGR